MTDAVSGIANIHSVIFAGWPLGPSTRQRLQSVMRHPSLAAFCWCESLARKRRLKGVRKGALVPLTLIKEPGQGLRETKRAILPTASKRAVYRWLLPAIKAVTCYPVAAVRRSAVVVRRLVRR